MSHGPSRTTYQPHIYPTIPSNTLTRQQPHQQQVLNQQFQQTLVTGGGPSPPHLHSINNTSHPASTNALTIGSNNSNNNRNSNNTNNNNSNSSNNTIHHDHHSNGHHSNDNNLHQSLPVRSTQETLYCDGCQTFRHISFFNEKEFKYSVCNLCHTREMQKRKHQQIGRFEIYNNNDNNNNNNANKDNERRLKQQRLQIQQQQQHQHQHQQQQQQQQQQHQYNGNSNNNNQQFQQLHSTTANQSNHITLGNSSNNSNNISKSTNINSSPQMKQSSPISHQQAPSIASLIPTLTSQVTSTLNATSNMSNGNNKHIFSSSTSSSDTAAITTSATTNTTSTTTATTNATTSPIRTQPPLHMIQSLPLVLPPATSSSTFSTRAETTSSRKPLISNSRNQNSDKFSQQLITLDSFVLELKKETNTFDRKQFHLDISPLIQNMGENAGFTQLGRGICEYVLEGTKFNFSLKDRRRSTKSPDTLSTLRYYCSQRADTAKPRKAEHPKAQNRYDCAGALTIIIDLMKKTAHVTVIHKYTHPPFVSHHHHHNQNSQNQQSKSKSQQQQQQQQKQEQKEQQQQQQQQPLPLPPPPLHQSPQHQPHPSHQNQQQQQPQLYHPSTSSIKHESQQQHQLYQLSQQLPPPLTIHQHHPQQAHQSYKQQQQQQIQNLRVLQQQQQQQKRQEVEQRFDLLRQKVADVEQLLEHQQTFGNKHFLKVASEALSGANDMLVAYHTPSSK